MADGVLVDAADPCRSGGVVTRHQLGELIEAVGMRIDVRLILQSLLQYHVGQAVEQHQIGARGDGQMNIRHLREHGDPRIDHDDWKLALLERHFQAPIDDRVLLRQVGTKRDQALGVTEIVVAAGRTVGAERALVAGDRRSHTERGIAVVIIGADDAPRKLAERIKLLGQNLPGRDNGDTVASILALNAGELCRSEIERLIPARFTVGVDGAFAQQRLLAAVSGIEQFVLEDALDTELALVNRCVADTARGDRLTRRVQTHFNGAAGRAVAAGGVLPVHHALVGDLDRVFNTAAEQHV